MEILAHQCRDSWTSRNGNEPFLKCLDQPEGDKPRWTWVSRYAPIHLWFSLCRWLQSSIPSLDWTHQSTFGIFMVSSIYVDQLDPFGHHGCNNSGGQQFPLPSAGMANFIGPDSIRRLGLYSYVSDLDSAAWAHWRSVVSQSRTRQLWCLFDSHAHPLWMFYAPLPVRCNQHLDPGPIGHDFGHRSVVLGKSSITKHSCHPSHHLILITANRPIR